MKKSLLKTLAFLLVVSVLLTGFAFSFSVKHTEGILPMKVYYDLPENSVDVLCLGSSHTYEGISPGILWQEYGISSYDLCSSAQSVWNSYFYLVEALKTQKPKVVILDTYMFYADEKDITAENIIKSTYGMKWSKNRIDALKSSIKEGEQWDYIIDVLQYHSKYSDLSQQDFYPDSETMLYKYSKGFSAKFNTTVLEEPTGIARENTCARLSEKTEEYYRKIIELSIENDFNLIVCSVPFYEVPYLKRFSNEAEAIALQYENDRISFINFNEHYDEIGLDFATDFADKQHLNYLGCNKFSKYLGKYLKDIFSLTDHSSDKLYESWETDRRIYLRQIFNYILTQEQNINNYAQLLKNCLSNQYKIVVTVNGISAEMFENYIEKSARKTMDEYSDMNNSELVASMEKEALKKAAEQLQKTKDSIKSVADVMKSFGFMEKESELADGIWIYENDAVTAYYNDEKGFFKASEWSRFDDFAAEVVFKGKTAGEDGAQLSQEEGNAEAYCNMYFNGAKKTSTYKGVSIFVYDDYLSCAVDSAKYEYESGTVEHK